MRLSAACGIAAAGILAVCAAAAGGPYRPPTSVPKTGIGFRGDGTGVFPGSKPPVEWDEKTGRNILWKAPLPNWGYSCPVPVGNRVLFMSEPGWKAHFPQLCCFDAETGKLLWQRDVDPFLAFGELSGEQRKALTADLCRVHDSFRAAYRICRPLEKYASAPEQEVAKAGAELRKCGMTISGYTRGYGLLRKLRYVGDGRKEIDRRLWAYGVKAETTWQRFGRARVGACFSTPISDAEHVFVMTLHGTAACFDMDGNLKWTRYSGYKVGPNTGVMASPRLYGDLLLTPFIDHGSKNCLLAAWDKRTGEMRWSRSIPGGGREGRASRAGASLVIMSVGATDVALCSTGYVVRLPDGKVFEARIDQTLPTWAVDDAHDAIHSAGSHDSGAPRIGVRLAIKGDTLEVADLYVLRRSYAPASPAFVAGRLFCNLAQLDPATGLILGLPPDKQADGGDVRRAPRSSPQTRHLLLAANGHVYGMYERKTGRRGEVQKCEGVGEVFTLDGRQAASNVLLPGPWEGEKLDQWGLQGFDHSFSYACSFNIGGDRIYACSNDYLYCIGSR